MVYLVDDDIEDIEIVQLALLEHKYEGPVRIIKNGRVLIDVLFQEFDKIPDAILLDLNMPLKDGFEVLSEIKVHPEFKNIPVVILTASSDKMDKIRCSELGCDFFYTKPTKMSEYKELVALLKSLTHKEV